MPRILLSTYLSDPNLGVEIDFAIATVSADWLATLKARCAAFDALRASDRQLVEFGFADDACRFYDGRDELIDALREADPDCADEFESNGLVELPDAFVAPTECTEAEIAALYLNIGDAVTSIGWEAYLEGFDADVRVRTTAIDRHFFDLLDISPSMPATSDAPAAHGC